MTLVFAVYGFLWWGSSPRTLGNDYSLFQPRQQLVFMQALRDGYFPLWLRGEFAGVPFAQYFFAGQYWPATWAMLAWEGVFEGGQLEVLTYVRLVTLGVAGVFTYLTMRRLGTTALPALLAGAVFLFNFRMLDAFRYGMALDVVVWMPAVVYLIECLIARPRLHLALLYGIAQYLLLVPGHMQEAIYCIYFATLYVLVRALMLVRQEGKRRPWRWLGVRAACLGGGQMLAFTKPTGHPEIQLERLTSGSNKA